MADEKLGESGAARVRQRRAVRPDPKTASAEGVGKPQALLAPIHRLIGSVLALPPVRRFREIYSVYDAAGGSLLAGGLAYGALFATLTGLLFGVGVLGYLVPRAEDRERLVNGFTGQLAPLAPVANDALANLAAHAGAFSLIGLVGMGWGASQFYGSLDTAIGRIFACGTARGTLDRILRGVVSVLLLVGGLLSGVAFSAIQAVVTSAIPMGSDGTAGRVLSTVGFPLATAAVVVVVVAVVYRVVPNTKVSWSALGVPALVTGLALTGLTETFVYLAPRLVGPLSLFGGFAAVFAALVWLSLAFRVLLVGAAWTWLRECPPEPC
jgi:YihY family inner membrane protein